MQVSEDEAIAFSGMQVVGKDAKTEVCDSVKENSRRTALGRTTGNLFNNKLGQGSDIFWSVWTRSVEFLWKRDVESVFGEVLCIGDDVSLIRLMNQTGPVLERLSKGTILEMMQALKHFLLKQKFLGSVIPWIQQEAQQSNSSGSENEEELEEQDGLFVRHNDSTVILEPREETMLEFQQARNKNNEEHVQCDEQTTPTITIMPRRKRTQRKRNDRVQY